VAGRWKHVILGALAGGACAMAVAQWNLNRLRREQEEFQRLIQHRMGQQSARSGAQIASLALQTAAIPSVGLPGSPATTPEGAPPANPAAQTNPPSRVDVWNGGQANVLKHLSESIDGAWAPRVALSLEQDLKRALKGTKGSLGALSCRSTSCLGKIDWASLADARKEVGNLLVAHSRVNCSRSAMIPPEAADESAPVQIQLLYDCAVWKAKGNDFPPERP
jgi:hypothetical protein